MQFPVGLIALLVDSREKLYKFTKSNKHDRKTG